MCIIYGLILVNSVAGSSQPKKWIIHLEGGGWCADIENCVERSKQILGSSKAWPEYITLSGFLSDDCLVNPDFCGWSMVFVGYCDGASFAGNVYVAYLNKLMCNQL